MQARATSTGTAGAAQSTASGSGDSLMALAEVGAHAGRRDAPRGVDRRRPGGAGALRRLGRGRGLPGRARSSSATCSVERAGTDPALPAVFVGSHLDTQPNGGRFDGPLGVLTAFEILRTLDDAGVADGGAAGARLVGQRGGCALPLPHHRLSVYSGALPLDDALAQPAHDGPTFGAELARLGLAGPRAGRPTAAVGGLLRAAHRAGHAARGSRRDDRRGAAGPGPVRACARRSPGVESHAGTTPMDRAATRC